MGWKDKADVIQGMAGIYIIFLIFLGVPGAWFGTFAPLQDVLLWMIIPVILGIVIIAMRENDGTDIFGIILVIIPIVFGSYLFMRGAGMIPLMPISISFVIGYFIYPIVGICLLLEAFDIIKPYK